MAKVLFFHGLNTFGDDQLHIGPLRFGTMHGPLVAGLRKLAIEVHPITGLGAGTPEELAERALAQNSKLFSEDQLILVGHSIGGLVARALAARSELDGRVQAVLTIGTPHFGALPAEYALASTERRSVLMHALKRLGYDAEAKALFFKPYTRQRLENFNRGFTARVPEFSFICELPRLQMALPLQFLYRQFHPRGESSDGFIHSASQKRGECAGPFALDHFGELGYFFAVSRHHRRQAANEFQRLLAAIAECIARC